MQKPTNCVKYEHQSKDVKTILLIHVGNIEDMGLACWVLHSQNGPASHSGEKTHYNGNPKMLLLEIIWIYIPKNLFLPIVLCKDY